MGNCNNKVKLTCGGVQNFAVCTNYKGSVSGHSELDANDCLDVQEVIEDVYDITEDIYSKIDMDELNNDCIVFTEPKTAKSVIGQLYVKLCQLEALIQTQQTTIVEMQEEIDDLQSNICQ